MIIYQPPTKHPPTPAKVLLMSGLSDPTTCALSPIQRRFLAALPVPENWKIYRNFPCLPGSEARGPGPPLWRASLANFRQFLLASRRTYSRAACSHWKALTDSTPELTVITLSCGLEIVNHCLPSTPPGCKVRVIALGPVAWDVPAVPYTLIQGERDYLSRFFFRTAEVVLPGVGHMNYLENEQTLSRIKALLCGSISRP